jgi:hypothetical protein
MKKLTIIIFLSWISLSWATNHYVDKNANGNNNGTSWSNAWGSFSDIEWNQIQPGDILFISGGSDSTVYNEQLTVGKSGTSANLITIRAGLDAGHNGRVIFDGGGSLISGINITYHDYIRIEKLEFRDHIGAGVGVRGDTRVGNGVANVIYFDSLTISGDGGGRGVAVDGWSGSTGFDGVRCQKIYL